jgi:thymidylate kinase
VLVSPYSGDVGVAADSLRQGNLFKEWASVVGRNHWRAPRSITAVYDRSVLTCLTELLASETPVDEIRSILDTWHPLPDVLFHCFSPVSSISERVRQRKHRDAFDDPESLNRYAGLYEKAADFLRANSKVNVERIDTSVPLEETLEQVASILKKHGLVEHNDNATR